MARYIFFKLLGDFSCSLIRLILMDNKRKSINNIAVENNINLNEVALSVIFHLIIERSIASCARFKSVKEIINNLVKRKFIMNIHSVGSDIIHILKYASFVLAHIHNRSDKFTRNIDMSVGKGLFAIIYICGVGIIGRVINLDHSAVGKINLINNGRNGCDKVKIIFPVESLLNNLKVEQTEKSASESKSESTRGFGFIRKRCVIKLQLFKSVTKNLIIGAVGRIKSAVNHGIYLTVAGQSLSGRIIGSGNRIADMCIAYGLNGSGDIAYLTGRKFICFFHIGGSHIADLYNSKLGTGGHNFHSVPGFDFALFYSDINYNATITVINRIKYKRLKRLVIVTYGRLNSLYYILKHFFYILACFCADSGCIHTRYTDNIFYFFSNSFGFCGRKVDFIYYRKNIEVMVKCKICICKGLRLNALRCVNDKNSALARRK